MLLWPSASPNPACRCGSVTKSRLTLCVYIYISLIVYSEIGISRKKIASVIRSWDLYKLEIKKESVQL